MKQKDRGEKGAKTLKMVCSAALTSLLLGILQREKNSKDAQWERGNYQARNTKNGLQTEEHEFPYGLEAQHCVYKAHLRHVSIA